MGLCEANENVEQEFLNNWADPSRTNIDPVSTYYELFGWSLSNSLSVLDRTDFYSLELDLG